MKQTQKRFAKAASCHRRIGRVSKKERHENIFREQAVERHKRHYIIKGEKKNTKLNCSALLKKLSTEEVVSQISVVITTDGKK